MTKVDERRCDVCGETINHGIHARLKRRLFSRFKLRLYEWGIVDFDGGTGWRRRRFDVHNDCLSDIVDEVARRAAGADDPGVPSGWSTATKRPVTVAWKGPFEDPDIVDTIEGDFEIDQEYIDEHGGFVLIRGVQGETYPCALDVFKTTYQNHTLSASDSGDGGYDPSDDRERPEIGVQTDAWGEGEV